MILITLLLVALAPAPQEVQKPEAMSLLGKPLMRRAQSADTPARRQKDLAATKADLAKKPDSAWAFDAATAIQWAGFGCIAAEADLARIRATR